MALEVRMRPALPPNPLSSSGILCFLRRERYREPMSVRRAAWIAHVQSWRDSDLSQADYCRRRALNGNTFAAWIKRCNSVPAQPPLTLTLVPVTVAQPAAAGELLLRHASSWQLAVPTSIEPAWLAGLLRGLV